jgi:beta-galactosidase
VPYQPGKLEAIGYNKGKRTASDKVITTGSPATVALSADRSTIKADRQDVSVIRVQVNDKNGLQVPVASNQVYFSISGPGRIIGVGNGDNTSLEPDKYLSPDEWKRKLFNGLAQVIIQSTGETGDIILTVRSGGLETAVIKIAAEK